MVSDVISIICKSYNIITKIYVLGYSLNLDNLLLQIGSQVTQLWNEFGQAVGIPQEVLNKCFGYPAEECIVEVLDYWLRNKNPTWKDVADGLREIGLQCLANGILEIYKTGIHKGVPIPSVYIH